MNEDELGWAAPHDPCHLCPVDLGLELSIPERPLPAGHVPYSRSRQPFDSILSLETGRSRRVTPAPTPLEERFRGVGFHPRDGISVPYGNAPMIFYIENTSVLRDRRAPVYQWPCVRGTQTCLKQGGCLLCCNHRGNAILHRPPTCGTNDKRRNVKPPRKLGLVPFSQFVLGTFSRRSPPPADTFTELSPSILQSMPFTNWSIIWQSDR